MDWKVGDWVVFDLGIRQVTEVRDGFLSASDGSVVTHGNLADQMRPLTLRNKRIVEYFDYYYNKLREQDGEAGFNYPDISKHFANLSLQSIDELGSEQSGQFHESARDFLKLAETYEPVIQGVALFRRNLRAHKR